MHLAFFILTAFALPHAYDEMEHRKIYEDNPHVYKDKTRLIVAQCICHGCCFIIHLIFETGMLDLCFQMEDQK